MQNRRWYIYILVIVMTLLVQTAASFPYALLVSKGSDDSTKFLELALILLPSAIALGALLLMVRYLHKGNPLATITSRKRFDFRRMLYGFLIWLGLSAAVSFLSPMVHPEEELVLTFQASTFFKALLIGVVLLPFQTGFEEVFFRGYLFNGCLKLTGRPWLSVIAIAMLFAAMHLANPEIEAYGIWNMLPQYLVMGLFMGTVAWLDKGLEGTIGMHFANNLFCLSFVSMDDSVLLNDSAVFHIQDSTCTFLDSIVLAVVSLIFLYLYFLIFRNRSRG